MNVYSLSYKKILSSGETDNVYLFFSSLEDLQQFCCQLFVKFASNWQEFDQAGQVVAENKQKFLQFVSDGDYKKAYELVTTLLSEQPIFGKKCVSFFTNKLPITSKVSRHNLNKIQILARKLLAE
jgi:hypothetical protein